MSCAVEQIGAALFAVPKAEAHHAVKGNGERGAAVDHRCVDDLASPGRSRGKYGAHNAECQKHAAATEVGNEIERRGRRSIGVPHGKERAAERKVVDVVPGGLGHRPRLTPAGHPTINQLGIVGETDIRPKAELLHHPRPKAFDQGVGFADQLAARLNIFRLFQVEIDGPAPAAEEVFVRPTLKQAGRLPFDSYDIGAEVGEKHGGEWAGPQACKLDDAEAGEWSAVGLGFAHGLFSLRRLCCGQALCNATATKGRG